MGGVGACALQNLHHRVKQSRNVICDSAGAATCMERLFDSRFEPAFQDFFTRGGQCVGNLMKVDAGHDGVDPPLGARVGGWVGLWFA